MFKRRDAGKTAYYLANKFQPCDYNIEQASFKFLISMTIHLRGHEKN